MTLNVRVMRRGDGCFDPNKSVVGEFLPEVVLWIPGF
jgi:hypothetical protein